jgi:hypothetical protein
LCNQLAYLGAAQSDVLQRHGLRHLGLGDPQPRLCAL